MSDCADVLRQMLSEKTGISLPRVTLGSRLAEDLGMDGDDAAEFFELIGQRFGTDLSALYANWNKYFGTEGIPLRAGLTFLFAAMIGGGISGYLGQGMVVAILIVISGLFIWSRFARRIWPSSGPVSITVAELVKVVQAGVWPTFWPPADNDPKNPTPPRAWPDNPPAT